MDRLEPFGIRLGLERTRGLLDAFDRPQLGMTPVLVAGTNGKGSTACLLAAIATAAGYRAGLYTSPHLESAHERIRVNGVAISEPRLAAALGAVLTAARELGAGDPTYFEALTVAALLDFRARDVEIAVLEVGLGGRLDATNAVEPALSVVTEIGFDHQRHLGSSLAEIAAEKAGILRTGVPAVAWVSEPEARAALERRAAALGVALRLANDDCTWRDAATLRTPSTEYRLRAPLAGRHQADNLALAVAAAESLARAGHLRIDRRAVAAGVAAARWPGRLEWVEPPHGPRVLLDGAHNPAAAAALGRYLEQLEGGHTLLFGVLDDKPGAEMLPPLAAGAVRVLLTRPRSDRATDPRRLAALLPAVGAEIHEPAPAALDAALRFAEPVVICGSLYLVGELRAELTRRWGRPPPAPRLTTFQALARR